MKTSLRVLAIGFSWMLIWGVIAFSAVALTTPPHMHGAISAVVGATLLAASLGLLMGVVYRLVIEIFATDEQHLRRLRADIILGTIVFLIILLALALTSYVKQRISQPEIQNSASTIQIPDNLL